jgi:pilus assembly protein CpaC
MRPTIEQAMTTFPKIKFRKDHKMKTGLIVSSLIGLSVFLSGPLGTSPAAFAADSNVSVAAATEQSNFVRIGQNKSVVIKLPAEARDVVVGEPGVVDVVVRAQNTAYLFGKSLGQTNIFFFDKDGNQILALDLEVARDMTGLRKLLDRKLPGNQITIDAVDTNIVLGGVARNGLEVQQAMDMANAYSDAEDDKNFIINTMTVKGEDQVMLKVKVVEIRRSVLKQFGINLEAFLSMGQFAFNLASYTLGSAAAGGSQADVSYTGTDLTVSSVIRALEGDGLVRTLAEPNLTALTGQTANFRAGGEFPYDVCSGTGSARTCTTEFRPYGVSLSFVPTVFSEDRIVLAINTDVSELGEITAGGVPPINRRTTQTVLEMPSGGSMMIAGLISENTRQKANGTPGLKKLPILGTLFRSHDFQSEETELVVIVTPILVNPTTQAKLTTPDKGFNPPSDKQAVFLGRLNKVYSDAPGRPTGKYHGNVGFIVE